MYILGISAMEHDPAAALVGEHGVIAAMEEGKLARMRSFEGIPRAAIQFCLHQAGIGWAQVHRIAIASRPAQGWSRQTLLRARLAPLAPISSSYFVNKAFGQLGTELNNFRILRDMAGPPRGRILPADHHLCHAASAYYASDFDRALILSLDENGGGRSGMAAIGEGRNIREIASLAFPHSLAWVFSQVTQLIGFRRRSDEHKTQWLSLAGDPVFASLFLEILRGSPQGPPHLDAKYFRRGYSGELSFSANFYRRLGISGIPGPDSQMGDPLRANLAASIQNACATIVSDWLETLRRKTGESNLALAGGLFLNPLLVAAIEKNTGFDEIFVQPAAGNEGTALGAAWLAWHNAPKRPRLPAMAHVHCGPAYSNEEIKSVLDNCKAAYRWCDSEDRIIEETLRLLEGGKIVAWFQGRAEFGPRALGHRSLLASPWAPYVKENLNDYVKHRESFRPFALSVPAGDVPEIGRAHV